MNVVLVGLQMRRLVATADMLMITHLDSDMIMDSIPLFDIERVLRVQENEHAVGMRSLSVFGVAEDARQGTGRRPSILGFFDTQDVRGVAEERSLHGPKGGPAGKLHTFSIKTAVGGANEHGVEMMTSHFPATPLKSSAVTSQLLLHTTPQVSTAADPTSSGRRT